MLCCCRVGTRDVRGAGGGGRLSTGCGVRSHLGEMQKVTCSEPAVSFGRAKYWWELDRVGVGWRERRVREKTKK